MGSILLLDCTLLNFPKHFPSSISKCVPVCQVDRRISHRQTVNPSILNPPTVYVQHHMTDDRTPSQKDDCIWGRAVGFAAGWLEVGTVFEGFHWADWSHLFYPALPHTAPTARTACPTPNTSFSSEASPASSAPSRHPRLIQGHCRSLLTHSRRRQRPFMCPWEYWWHMRVWDARKRLPEPAPRQYPLLAVLAG